MKHGSHTQYDIEYHMVWTTKYRYKILQGKIAERCREIVRQICEQNGITIIRGNIGREHVHILISCPPTISPAEIAKKLKGRSSRLLKSEYKELNKRYFGEHLRSNGYFCRTVGMVTEEIIKEYIENQKDDIDEIFKINGRQLQLDRTFSPQKKLCTFSAEFFTIFLFITIY